MNRAQRRAHLAVWLAAAPVLLALLAAAILLRPPPIVQKTPGAVQDALP